MKTAEQQDLSVEGQIVNCKKASATVICSEKTLIPIITALKKDNDLDIVAIRKCNRGSYHIWVRLIKKI